MNYLSRDLKIVSTNFWKESSFGWNIYLSKKANKLAQLAWNLINGKGSLNIGQMSPQLLRWEAYLKLKVIKRGILNMDEVGKLLLKHC